MVIRAATSEEAQAIADIWNRIIRETATTFTTAEKTPVALAKAIAGGDPYWVADEAGEVVGFATYSQFRGGPGYIHTMEHSVHIAPSAQGKGLGRTLMTKLESEARKSGVHSLLAAISGENQNGIRFHAAMGYQQVAHLPQVGWKFGRWHDLVLMQKFL